MEDIRTTGIDATQRPKQKSTPKRGPFPEAILFYAATAWAQYDRA
jgi:hypothetical protein